jgi:hypothetical protein
MLSGHGDTPMSVRATEAGAEVLLTKPFRDEDLMDATLTASMGKSMPFLMLLITGAKSRSIKQQCIETITVDAFIASESFCDLLSTFVQPSIGQKCPRWIWPPRGDSRTRAQ